ncbi:MAG: hypothetical protein Q8N05_12460 [Bacteroidota bacterium]|nr:hypothetical protein [Bacteroidota bacterium]
MPAIPHIKKKIGRAYLVWFQNSNLYLQLEEPAWFVFSKTIKRYKPDTIVEAFSVRYGISLGESSSFVREIRLKIEKMNQTDHVRDQVNEFSIDLNKLTFLPFSVHRYRLGNKLVEFSFETHIFEHYLHPLICHFETTEEVNEITLFELFAHQEQIVFRFNGEVKGIWTKDETQLAKGLIFMFLINVMYDKTDTDWLMTVHASAITNGKKTILFSAPPNHGKTTIAALLQKLGYQLISDDFVPIDRNSLMAHPFPIAMSVKETSMYLLSPLFPALNQKPLNYISLEKSVRYLAPDFNRSMQEAVFPVHEFIFIHYDRSVDFIWEKLDPVRAVKLLLDQAWIVPTRGNAELLFNRILQMPFYQLTYSNNQKALDAITNLFDQD